MLNDGNYNYYNREPTRSPWSPQPHQGDATIGLDQIERSTHAVLHQFLTSYPDSNHPGCDQLRQLTVLLKDPVFREIYKFNCENKELFKSQTSTVISSTLPDNFYRVHFPARPGSSWGFSVGGVELSNDPNEVSIPRHEQVCKLVVDNVEAANVDRKEAHLRMLIRPGDELILINNHVIQTPKHFKALTNRLSGRNDSVEFVFEQNLLNDSNLHKSVLRFQEQKLVVNLEMREVGGSFGFAIVSFQRLTVVEKLVENGVASKDGRLKKGDIVQCINNMPIGGLNSNEVVGILKACGTMTELTIVRYQRFDFPIRFDKNLNHFYHVTLTKIFGSLGINIRSLPGSKDFKDERLFIKDVVPGSPADKCGMIQPMDQIVGVNGQSISHLTKEDSLKLLKQNSNEVHLTFLREVEMLPLESNSSVPEQESVENRKELYQERMGSSYTVEHCQVSIEHFLSMVKELRLPNGDTKYFIDEVPQIRNNSSFGKALAVASAYPLEPGDQILEIDGIQTINMDPLNPVLPMFYGPEVDRRRFITVVFCRIIAHEYTRLTRVKDTQKVSRPNNAYIENPVFETVNNQKERGIVGQQSPQMSRRNPIDTNLQLFRPEKFQKFQDITRSDLSEGDTLGDIERRSQSNERLIKHKNPNITKTSNESHSKSDQNIYREMVIAPKKKATTAQPVPKNKGGNKKSHPDTSKYQTWTSPQMDQERKVSSDDPRVVSYHSASNNEYDELRRSKMTEYQEIFPEGELSSIHSKTETAADSKANAYELELSSVHSRGDATTTEAERSITFVESSWEPTVQFCAVRKVEGESMGLKISQVNLENDVPVIVVQEIVEGGEAEKADILAPNDRIVQVMNFDTSKWPGRDFVSLMNQLPNGQIKFGIRKYIPPSYHQIQGSDLGETPREMTHFGSEYADEQDGDPNDRQENLTEESVKEDKSDKPLLKSVNKKMYSAQRNEVGNELRNLGRRNKAQNSASSHEASEEEVLVGYRAKQESRKDYHILDNTLSTNRDESLESHLTKSDTNNYDRHPHSNRSNSTSKSLAPNALTSLSNSSENAHQAHEETSPKSKSSHIKPRLSTAKKGPVNDTGTIEDVSDRLAEAMIGSESNSNVDQTPSASEQIGSPQPEDGSTLSQLTKWPEALFRTIVIEKQPNQLMGMGLVSPHDKRRQFPFNDAGMLVRSISPDGLIGEDGRIQEGDYLIAINGYELGSVPSELQGIMQMAMSDPRFHNIVELQFVSSEDAEYFLQNGEIPSTTSSRTTPRDSLNSEGAEEAYREEVPSSTEQVPPGESSKTQVSGSNQVPDYSMLVNRTSINDSVNQSQEPSFDQVTLGPKRFVEIVKGDDEPLGISIVDYSAIGIIVQSIREGSPADMEGPDRIYPWDRLTSVNGKDLTTATREQAINIIRQCRSPLRFIVQSIVFVNDRQQTQGNIDDIAEQGDDNQELSLISDD